MVLTIELIFRPNKVTESMLAGRTGGHRQQVVIRRMVKVNTVTAMAKWVEDISYNTHGFQWCCCMPWLSSSSSSTEQGWKMASKIPGFSGFEKTLKNLQSPKFRFLRPTSNRPTIVYAYILLFLKTRKKFFSLLKAVGHLVPVNDYQPAKDIWHFFNIWTVMSVVWFNETRHANCNSAFLAKTLLSELCNEKTHSKSGSGKWRRKIYKFTRNLDFLRPHMRLKNTVSPMFSVFVSTLICWDLLASRSETC